MGFFAPSASKRAALDARHAAKLAAIQSKFEAEEAERARLDAEAEATYLHKLELLSRNALFDALTEDDLDALADVMRRVEVKAGKRVLRHKPKSERDRASKRGVMTSLFGAGKAKHKPAAPPPPLPDDDTFDRDEALYVVDSGSLDVSVGDDGVAVTLHPGDAVGELEKLFLAPRDRAVSVVANTDAVLWAVPGHLLRRKKGFKAVVAKAVATRAAWDPLLVAVPLLASALTPFQRAFLAAKLHPFRFESHEPVAMEDEEAHECWMLMEGECVAYAALVGGDERRVRKFFPGDPFAEASLARVGLTYEHTVRAGEHGAELARLDADDFSAAFGRSATWAAADAFCAEMCRAASRGVLGLVDDAVADEMAGFGERGVAARPRTPPTPSPRRRRRDESAAEWLANHAIARASSPPEPQPQPPPLVIRPRRRPRTRPRGARAPFHPLEWETDSEVERAKKTDPNAETPREERERDDERREASRASVSRRPGSDPTTGLRPKPPLGPPPEGEARLARLLACLEAHPLFEGAERRALRAAVAEMELRVVPPGGALFRAGEAGDYLYVVEAGELDVTTPDPEGGSPRGATRARSGSIVGDVALTHAPARRDCDAVACSRGAKTWGMRARWFERVAGGAVHARRGLASRFAEDVPLLAGLPAEERFAVAEKMREATFAPGEIIMTQGDRADYFYVLEEGAAKATVRVRGEPEPLVVARYARGSYFGELEFLERGRPRAATVTAFSHCRCAAVEAEAFLELVAEGTQLRKRLQRECQTYVTGVFGAGKGSEKARGAGTRGRGV